MNAQTLISQLEKMDGTPKELPSWPFSPSIIEALTANPNATISYIKDRLNKQFHDRDEIGAHLDAFSDLTGISRSNLSIINLELKLQTRKTLLAIERDTKALEVRGNRLKTLDTVVDFIKGYASLRATAYVNDVSYRAATYLLKQMEKEYKFNSKDLKFAPTPRRRALATKISTQQTKKIDEAYAAILADDRD